MKCESSQQLSGCVLSLVATRDGARRYGDKRPLYVSTPGARKKVAAVSDKNSGCVCITRRLNNTELRLMDYFCITVMFLNEFLPKALSANGYCPVGWAAGAVSKASALRLHNLNKPRWFTINLSFELCSPRLV